MALLRQKDLRDMKISMMLENAMVDLIPGHHQGICPFEMELDPRQELLLKRVTKRIGINLSRRTRDPEYLNSTQDQDPTHHPSEMKDPVHILDHLNGLKRPKEKTGLDPIPQEIVEIGVIQGIEVLIKRCQGDLNPIGENEVAVDLEIGTAMTARILRNQMFLVSLV